MIIDGAIVHEVDYPHPPARVWRALVESSELAVWLMPNDFAANVGHRFVLDARPSLGHIDGEVLLVEVERQLRCRWSGPFGDTVVEFQLTPTEAGTRLRIEHRGWDDGQPEPRHGFDQGWHAKLTVDLRGLLAATSPPTSGGPS